jgi:tetratricopeptide (TPR) repeat protein
MEKAITLFSLANLYWDLENWSTSLSLAEEALTLFQELGSSPHDCADCCAAIAINLRELGRIEEAYLHLDLAINYYQAAGTFEMKAWENTRAWWHFQDQHWEISLNFYQLNLLENENESRVMDVAGDHFMIGRCLIESGRPIDALSHLRRARDLFSQNSDLFHATRSDLFEAKALLLANRSFESKVVLDRAIKYFATHYLPRDSAMSHKLMGISNLNSGNYHLALLDFEKATNYLVQEVPINFHEIVEVSSCQIQCLNFLDRKFEAEDLQRRNLVILEILGS